MRIPALAAVLVCSLPGLAFANAQDAHTGVSTPPAEAQTNVQQADPSDAGYPPGYQPTPAPAQRRDLHSETYLPYNPSGAASAPATTPAPDVDATVVGGAPATIPLRTRTSPPPSASDPDAQVVFSEPGRPNEFRPGTIMHTRLRETLSTTINHPGDPFTAVVIEPIYLEGHVLIPPGSKLEGHLTEVPGRIHGAAALHLEPRRLVLPDGTSYVVHAQIIDSDQSFATHIDSEGTIYRRDKITSSLTAVGLGAGAGAVTGAVIGGGVGAVVGATVGAGIGTAWWLKQDRQTVIPTETGLVFSLNEPLTINSAAR